MHSSTLCNVVVQLATHPVAAAAFALWGTKASVLRLTKSFWTSAPIDLRPMSTNERCCQIKTYEACPGP